MRQIKFRGQRVDNKEWVAGFYGWSMGKHYITVINYAPPTWSDPGGDYFEKSYEVIPETVGQYIGHPDKNSKDVYVGDIVEGYMGWMTGDGRLRRGFPSKIRVRLEVGFSDGRIWDSGFYLKQIGVHPDDKEANDKYFYRSVLYCLEESRECELKDNEYVWKGINETIEVIGNIHSNPELLNQ